MMSRMCLIQTADCSNFIPVFRDLGGIFFFLFRLSVNEQPKPEQPEGKQLSLRMYI